MIEESKFRNAVYVKSGDVVLFCQQSGKGKCSRELMKLRDYVTNKTTRYLLECFGIIRMFLFV